METHTHDESTEPFPRHETAELVARELAARERGSRFERVQVPLVVAGLVLLLLAFPTQALFGRTVDLVGASARGVLWGTELVPALLAGIAVRTTGFGAEQVWFAIAALACAMTTWPLVAMARERGWDRGTALFVALVALSAPVVLVAGSTPSAGSAEMLGAAWLFAELARSSSPPWRRAAVWIFACTLHVANLWTWPALLLVVAFDPSASREAPERIRGVFVAVGAALVFAAVFIGAHAFAGDLAAAGHQASRALLAGGSGGPGPIVAWWSLWLPALGAVSLGAITLMLRLARATAGGARSASEITPDADESARRRAEAGAFEPVRPPEGRIWRRELWILLFAFVPWIAFSLGGSIDWELPWLWLVPVGALGLLEGLQQAEERGHGAAARLVGVALVVFGLLGAAWIRGLDGDARWRDAASATLNPGDVVMSASAEHLHLLHERFHVETVDLRPIARRPREERARFFAEEIARSEALADAGRRLALDEDSLYGLGTLAWPDARELDLFADRARPVCIPDELVGTPHAR